MSDFNEKYDFVWTIENYLLLDLKSERIRSPSFQVKLLNGTEWTLDFVLDESETPSQMFLELNLCLRSPPVVSKVTTSFKIEFCNAEEKVILSAEMDEVEFLKYAPNRFQYSIFNLIRTEEMEKTIKDSAKDILIIRCIGIPSGATAISPPKRILAAQTEVCFNMFSFYWDVECSDNPNWSATKTFTIKEEDKSDIEMCINIKYQQDDVLFDIKEIKRFINVVSELTRRVKCEIILRADSDGEDLLSSCDFFTFENTWNYFIFGDTWHFPSFFKKSLLEESDHSLKLMRLKFNFSFRNRRKYFMSSRSTENVSLRSFPTVSKNISSIKNFTSDIRAMLLNEEHSDVTFRIGNETTSAHKFILASRSPVFSAMLKQQMSEKETGVINITDMDLQTLRLFLEFLYTGEIEVKDCDRALDLLLAADKYQVSSLKEKCSEFLKKRVTTDNVCDVFLVADMVSHQYLKNIAADYIKENAEEVLNSSKWCVLIDKNPKICSEIISNFSKDLKSLYIKTGIKG